MLRSISAALIIGVLVTLAAPWRGFIRDPRRSDGVPVVEMAVFEAGFGAEWHRALARVYERERARTGRPIKIDLWGDPRVVDKVRPRILARRPPVLIDAYLPFWTLVLSDMLLPFDEMLDRPAPGLAGKRIRDTFYPGALAPFTCQGKTYAIPTVYNAWVVWYDKRLFREHGWRVPVGWRELIALCDTIKRTGLAPVAFQGKYSVYASCYFWHLVQSCGGIELFDRCQAMDPGAFVHPDALEAVQRLQHFALNCFQPGSTSMTHTEAQTEFCLGRAALVACGLWFENEMRGVIPPDFELSAFPLPPVLGGKGSPAAIYAGPAEMVYLLRDGQNAGEALDFAAYMLTVENMRSWASHMKVLSAVAPANRQAALSPAMETVRGFLDRMTMRYVDALETYAQGWELQCKRPLLDGLIRGELAPEACARGLEDGLELLRRDPDFVRPHLEIRRNPAPASAL